MKTENVAESHQTDIPYTFPAGHETSTVAFPPPPREGSGSETRFVSRLGRSLIIKSSTLTTLWCNFCLGTEVPRHSAGCVGTYVRIRRFSQCARASAACSTRLIGCQTYL